MKKLIFIAGLFGAIGLAVFIFGYAFAQTPEPPAVPWGSGMMGPRGMMGGGGRMGGAYGSMHSFMVNAVADALELTPDEINAAIAEGKTIWQIAEAQGLSAEEVQALMIEARQQAVGQMVEAGVLTQEQAEWMLSRMQNMPMGGGGAGPGSCPGMRGRSPRGI